MKKLSFITLVILTSFVCGLVSAQEVTEVTEVTTVAPPEPAKQRFDIGAGYWWTDGSLVWYVYAPEDDGIGGLLYKKGDKISKLDYDTDTGLFIVNAEAWIWWRFYVGGFVGWGDIDGDVGDSDWYPQYDPALMHFSKSDIEGDVTTWNINGYLRVIEEPEDKGYLDLALGYFYYQDDIEHMKNGTQILWYWETINEPLTGLDSSNKHTSDGIRLGVRGKIRLHDRIAIKASGGICPWLDVEDKAYWNLRDMKMDKEADGTAFDLNLGIEFKLTKNLFVEAGYKYINIDSDKGDDTRTWADGTKSKLKDSYEAEVSRGGFYGMGRLKF